MVATKTALSVRIDALSDADTKIAEDAPLPGIENRVRLEARLRMLEQGLGITSIRRQTTGASMNKQAGKFALQGNGASYNTGADALIPSQPVASTSAAGTKQANGVSAQMDVDGEETAEADTRRKEKKDKKRKRQADAEYEEAASDAAKVAPAQLEASGDVDEKERKRQKKAAKAAKKLEQQAALEIGDASLVSMALGDATNADASGITANGHSMTNGHGDADEEAERKRRKAEKKAKKAAKAQA